MTDANGNVCDLIATYISLMQLHRTEKNAHIQQIFPPK